MYGRVILYCRLRDDVDPFIIKVFYDGHKDPDRLEVLCDENVIKSC